MVFMADVFVPCDTCGGRRFKADVLEVAVRGRTVHDVLQMTVDEAIRFFPREEKLGQALWQLQQVGLGYLRLGPAGDHALGRRGAAREDRARAARPRPRGAARSCT
jgi:excinuclease ABC subunit A